MKVIKYFFVGGVAAFFDISVFSIFTIYLGYPWIPVSIATFIIATLINYYLSINFVFISGEKFPVKQEILLVFLVLKLSFRALEVLMPLPLQSLH